MADEEVQTEAKFFNVKNTSLRLVHFGALMIPPEQVGRIFDDEKGINRATVEASFALEETDEEATIEMDRHGELVVESSEEETAKPVKAATKKTTAEKKVVWGGNKK